MRSPAVLVLGLARGTLGLANPAIAFGDCIAEGYLAKFADAPTAGDLACFELFRIFVATPDGPREVRGIADAAFDWAAPPLWPKSNPVHGWRAMLSPDLDALRSMA